MCVWTVEGLLKEGTPGEVGRRCRIQVRVGRGVVGLYDVYDTGTDLRGVGEEGTD